MLVDEAQQPIDEYARWIGQSMIAFQRGSAVEVVTSMLNRDNDHMSVYVNSTDDGTYTITDLGETIANLEFGGVGVSTGQRRARLDRILAGYGVEQGGDGELWVKASRSELPQRFNMLLQAMASVDDMYLLSQDAVRNLFTDDVRNWLLQNDIRCVESPLFTGKSGMPYRFDFAIGRSKEQPERLVKVINTPKRESVMNALFWWSDIQQVRRDSKGYVFLNSKNARGGAIKDEVMVACRNYGVTPVRWGIDETAYVKELVA